MVASLFGKAVSGALVQSYGKVAKVGGKAFKEAQETPPPKGLSEDGIGQALAAAVGVTMVDGSASSVLHSGSGGKGKGGIGL